MDIITFTDKKHSLLLLFLLLSTIVFGLPSNDPIIIDQPRVDEDTTYKHETIIITAEQFTVSSHLKFESCDVTVESSLLISEDGAHLEFNGGALQANNSIWQLDGHVDFDQHGQDKLYVTFNSVSIFEYSNQIHYKGPNKVVWDVTGESCISSASDAVLAKGGNDHRPEDVPECDESPNPPNGDTIFYTGEEARISSDTKHKDKVVIISANNFYVDGKFELEDCETIITSMYLTSNKHLKFKGGSLEITSSDWTVNEHTDFESDKKDDPMQVVADNWALRINTDKMHFKEDVNWVYNQENSCMDGVERIEDKYHEHMPIDITQIKDCDNWDLPVELIYFEAEAYKDGASLFWATASEINSDYFDVQFSKDGRNWESLEKVPAAGNSNVQIEYQYDDYTVRTGVGYYRLHQVDFDGQSEIFGPVVVEFSTSNIELEGEIYPVPQSAGSTVHLSVNNNLPYDIQIFNHLGQLVFYSEDNVNSIHLETPWGRGIFIVHIVQGADKEIVKFQLN
ncbi:T9SS type A sorting domain-containing protein [Flammeovirga agarivorans]|uniref:T9SS type A sorting domain-containing protein n=1 Tax=Flammeovirga agarivorans TaxID=2726742 RepID=A0A7X8SIK2_9BACT|nr:T9SS type A sorting domain-containing protein [Flammeovirga agarivorans]NLR90846.1 T9SS type A sorting domain-containing protein [Flammeovirga agarivorans]